MIDMALKRRLNRHPFPVLTLQRAGAPAVIEREKSLTGGLFRRLRQNAALIEH